MLARSAILAEQLHDERGSLVGIFVPIVKVGHVPTRKKLPAPYAMLQSVPICAAPAATIASAQPPRFRSSVWTYVHGTSPQEAARARVSAGSSRTASGGKMNSARPQLTSTAAAKSPRGRKTSEVEPITRASAQARRHAPQQPSGRKCQAAIPDGQPQHDLPSQSPARGPRPPHRRRSASALA